MNKATHGNPRPQPDDYDDEEYEDGPVDAELQAAGQPDQGDEVEAQPLVTRRSRTAQTPRDEEAEYDEYDEDGEGTATVVTSPARAAAIGVSLFLLVAIFAAVVWLLTSNNSNDGISPGPNVPQTTLAGVPTIKGFKETSEQQAPTKGAFAPDFTWDEGGNEFALSSFRGDKPVFVNFWGTWCPPCRAEMPEMEAFYQKHRSEIEVIGVSMVPRDDPPGVFQFVQAAPYSWKFLHDGTYDVATRYSVMSVPSSYFVDKSGVVKVVHVGAMNGQQMESYLLDVR